MSNVSGLSSALTMCRVGCLWRSGTEKLEMISLSPAVPWFVNVKWKKSLMEKKMYLFLAWKEIFRNGEREGER